MFQVAVAVANCAFDLGVARVPKPKDLPKFIRDRMWAPCNPELDASVADKTIPSAFEVPEEDDEE